MATNAKNLAELLNTDTTVKVGDIEDGSVTTAKIADSAVTSAKALNLGRRNLVINGGTLIWQRATAATASVNAQLTTCDRVMNQFSHGGATTTERSTDVPAGQGFQYSLKHVVTTADASMGTDDYYDIYQTRFEGNDVARLCYGTSGAKKTSLSFWIKSSVAGVYNGALTSHTAKVKLPFNFTISSADTWEHIKIENLPGATAGADDGEAWIVSGNNLGLTLRIFGMLGTRWTGATDRTWNTANAETAYGSSNSQVNWMGTLSNTLYITGVQFEVSDASTDFEHRSVGEELSLCQRYYVNHGLGSNAPSVVSPGADAQYSHIRSTQVQFPVAMRANPTVTIQSSSANSMDRYGRGQETCYPQAEGITTFGFDVIRSRDSGGSNRAWTDTGLYLNRAGYSAEAEI